MSSVVNPAALSAVMRRQLWSLLGNPLGYVFILAFVLAGGATLFLFQGDKYFARNIADLGPLLIVMPLFLVVLLPALAMGAWATEREQGTEELLLTMYELLAKLDPAEVMAHDYLAKAYERRRDRDGARVGKHVAGERDDVRMAREEEYLGLERDVTKG